MADLAASDGAEGAEKLGNDREKSAHPCAEAMRGPSLHEGGGDRTGLKEKSTDDGAKSASENRESGMCAGVSSSTPVTVVGQDAQGSSKTIADPFIDSPQPTDTASEDANEGEGVEHSGSGKEKSESDEASPTSDPERKGAVLSGGVAEESALHEHAPAVGASCGPCKEESGLGETVVGSVTEHAGPDDETGEDSDHYEDAPAGPDKDNSEADNAASVTNPIREEAEQPELTGDSGPVKYEDPSFDEDDLKGDVAEPAADSVGKEQEPASLPTDDSPLFEDASSFSGPDSDSAAVAQVEKVPVVPVDQTDKVCGTSAGGLGEEPEETPSSSVLSSVAVATSSHKDQVEEGQHVDPSCGPPRHVQAKSWADDEPLVASPELEGGHEAAADDPSPGHPGDISEEEEEEEAGEELELQLQPDELDYDSGIVEGGTTGPGEGDEEDEEDCIEGERQQGDGEESVDPSDVVDKELDYDEDKRNPQYIPKKGAFYQHDDRMVGDEEAAEVQEEKKEDDKGSQRNKKKLWQDDGVWSHDMFNEDEQTPKSKEEIVATYGYDIRSETMPPRARRRRRYGRGPNKYQRNWEDEDAYSARPGFGRGGGSMRGGHRGRGGGPVGNPSFRDEDFPDLNAKPLSSGSAANQDTGSEHHRSSGGPPPQQDWDHSAGNSGQSRRGWGRRPQAQRRPSDGGSPKRPENELTKEVAPLSHRGGAKPAPRPPLKASEPLLHGAPGKARAGKHTPTEPERSLRGAELGNKPASKVEAKEGGGGAESKNTAVVAPRTGPLGSTETTVKPKRYSSLRQRPIIEAASYTQEPAVVAPQGPQPGPDRPQPAILTAAHFQAPYSPYPDGYMLPPPGQAPAVMPPQNQPPAVMAAPGQIPGSFLPGPTGLVSFPPQYPPPYTFPAQYAPPAPAAQAVSHVSGPNIPQTQAQKPPYYHGDIIYYNTQSQQHKQRPTPARRPKAAIPIVPPPDSHGGGAQEVPCEPDGCVSHQSRSDEDLEDRGIVGAGPTVQEGVAGQQAVEL